MAGKKKGKAAKTVLVVAGVVTIGVAGSLSAVASQYVPLIAPGTTVAGIQVGGLTLDAASSKLSEWWATVSSSELRLSAVDLSKQPQGFKPNDLGVEFDSVQTLQSLPIEYFWANTIRKISGSTSDSKKITPTLRMNPDGLKGLADYVTQHLPPKSPAKVDYVNGQILRTPEKVEMELDMGLAEEVVLAATLSGTETEIPVKKAKAKISENDLATISEVVSNYTTRYNQKNGNRSHNIQNAANRLNGTILMPGESFSFNKFLGQRTSENGFKLAGVYNNGKHDFDIGGGICQVSSTLYNSILLANLKVANRSCHTFPVPYVPVGRDATVSFPAPDFAFTNSLGTPIALAVKAGGGSITFTILGMKDPGLVVKIETSGHSSWSRPVKEINDPSLPPGKRVVEEPGGSGHRITTYRVVTRNGKEVDRENLGVSLYNGGSRIVRVNKSAPKSVPSIEVPGKPVEDESQDGIPPSVEGGGPPSRFY